MNMKQIIWYSTAIVASILMASNVSAECSVGDEKCGPSGGVMECQSLDDTLGPDLKTQWKYSGERCDNPDRSGPSSGSACTVGDEACDDGFLLRCITTGSRSSPTTEWRTQIKACK